MRGIAGGPALARLRERKPVHGISVPHPYAGWPAARWRVLDVPHRKRNLAEYEGVLDVEESAIKELRDVAAELIADLAKLTGAPKPKP